MDDYISRQTAIAAAIKMFNAWYGHSWLRTNEIRARFEQLPSADAQPVVRCKDCKYCDTGIDEDGNHFLKCLGWAYGGTKEDDYCSHGVRKDG